MNWTESPMHEFDSITASHKLRIHSSVIVRVAESSVSDLGSILSQVVEYFVNLCYRPTFSKRPNGNSANVLSPICHSAVHAQTQTQREIEVYKMHVNFILLNSSN